MTIDADGYIENGITGALLKFGWGVLITYKNLRNALLLQKKEQTI